MSADWSGGLAPEKDLVFAACPDDPQMRESVSLWLFEQNGEFAFPRLGIEAEAACWDDRLYQANFAFAGGRVLNGAGRGAAHPALGATGQPTVLGAGPLRCECLQPFRRWRIDYDGDAVDGTVAQQIARQLDPARRTPLRFEAVLEMAAPAWVQDNTPEKLATMTEAQRLEAGHMGIGYRIEQMFRATGRLWIDGGERPFEAVGSRIHRQSVRPLAGFRGHCWQSAVFPDGRAFGYIAYPPADDGSTPYNEGYIWQDGRMHPARAVNVPWLRRIVGEGDDVSLELESALGITRIEALSGLSTFRVGNPDIGGLNLQQGGARYRWGDQQAWGMIERSSPEQLTRIG
jgi:hypothetical protein